MDQRPYCFQKFGKFRISTGFGDTEEAHRIVQARLAYQLNKRAERKLLDEEDQTSSTADSSSDVKKYSGPSISFPQHLFAPQTLQVHENPIKLTDVFVSLPRTGERIFGTLESHANGLKFIAAEGFHVLVIVYADVLDYFFRPADDKWSVPLMLFRLLNPIMVVKQETVDIQFYSLAARNDNLADFARVIHEARRTCGGRPPKPLSHKEFEFDGVSDPAIGLTSHVLTHSALVVLGLPCIVLPLCDIEIVNLAVCQPEVIDMTIVFEDFNRGVFVIRSTPSEFLTGIKRCLNSALVKYYVNESKVKWDVLVRDIAKYPKLFQKEGRWDSLELEDKLTSASYLKSDPDLDFLYAPASKMGTVVF